MLLCAFQRYKGLIIFRQVDCVRLYPTRFFQASQYGNFPWPIFFEFNCCSWNTFYNVKKQRSFRMIQLLQSLTPLFSLRGREWLPPIPLLSSSSFVSSGRRGRDEILERNFCSIGKSVALQISLSHLCAFHQKIASAIRSCNFITLAECVQFFNFQRFHTSFFKKI